MQVSSKKSTVKSTQKVYQKKKYPPNQKKKLQQTAAQPQFSHKNNKKQKKSVILFFFIQNAFPEYLSQTFCRDFLLHTQQQAKKIEKRFRVQLQAQNLHKQIVVGPSVDVRTRTGAKIDLRCVFDPKVSCTHPQRGPHDAHAQPGGGGGAKGCVSSRTHAQAGHCTKCNFMLALFGLWRHLIDFLLFFCFTGEI